MKFPYLFIVAAGAMTGGCVERLPESPPQYGQTYIPKEGTGSIDSIILRGSPSGRYGRPSTGGGLKTQIEVKI